MRRWLALTSVIFLLAAETRAEPRRREEVGEGAVDPAVEAARHFEAALEYYRSGKYREALAELEVAYGLDPTGKDLVYNLAIVSEKLGRLDDAIRYFTRYLELETEERELGRARDAIRRLEGARVELAPPPPPPPPPARPCPPVSSAPVRAPGKLDEWVYATGGLSAAAFVVGTVLGVQALARDPRGERTGDGVSVGELEARVDQARNLARLADVAFAVSLLSGSGAVLLYFGRTPDSPRHAELTLSGSF
jgi:tetratricopeptide (TPR) repeat protein